ncbi:MAG: hypothetical protein ACOX1P_23710 [Thermoguttaceae bacterium]|jgi:hypothetical protein
MPFHLLCLVSFSACALLLAAAHPTSHQPPAALSNAPDLGDQKQLFLDGRFFERADRATLTMNPPKKIGPVLLPDRPWEPNDIGFYSTPFNFHDNSIPGEVPCLFAMR